MTKLNLLYKSNNNILSFYNFFLPKCFKIFQPNYVILKCPKSSAMVLYPFDRRSNWMFPLLNFELRKRHKLFLDCTLWTSMFMWTYTKLSRTRSDYFDFVSILASFLIFSSSALKLQVSLLCPASKIPSCVKHSISS